MSHIGRYSLNRLTDTGRRIASGIGKWIAGGLHCKRTADE